MAIKLLPDLETQKRIADAIEEVANKIGTAGAGGGYIEINYADLVALRNNSQLVPGAFYRITDYETTTVQAETRSAGHLFDIIVQALDEKTVSENAFAINSARDTETYFANSKLEAWKLKYCLDNDTDRFTWADEVNGKGVIYRMIDEFNNDVPYDFKNIQFKRKLTAGELDLDSGIDTWVYTFTGISSENFTLIDGTTLKASEYFTDEESNLYKNNKIGIYEYKSLNEDGHDKIIQECNNIVFIGSYDEEPYGEEGPAKLVLFSYNNILGMQCYNMTIGNNFRNNTIGNSFNYNTIGNDFYGNTIGNNFVNNTIGNNFRNNTIGNNFNYNTIGNDFVNNTIGNDFVNNTIGNSFNYNTVDENVQYIQFSVDGDYSNIIRYLHLKSGLRGASSANRLDLYYAGLYGREYPTTFEIIANDNIISSWEATPLTRAGKVKATKTTATWSDI